MAESTRSAASGRTAVVEEDALVGVAVLAEDVELVGLGVVLDVLGGVVSVVEALVLDVLGGVVSVVEALVLDVLGVLFVLVGVVSSVKGFVLVGVVSSVKGFVLVGVVSSVKGFVLVGVVSLVGTSNIFAEKSVSVPREAAAGSGTPGEDTTVEAAAFTPCSSNAPATAAAIASASGRRRPGVREN
ncbi:hypothetical protein EH165_00745 [Nakamurella antarctica]|uniref:Uncharacterized protein n=1 Tax=Nakamurella antarctica TaxID=1902245 RepID=A0A3G8ZQT5_9ACTN|nr:hypothetical protein [Nakamurella antarctica]AZI56914.1 hypothetical protein EH165_00745 [Nakamurella antarctica]